MANSNLEEMSTWLDVSNDLMKEQYFVSSSSLQDTVKMVEILAHVKTEYGQFINYNREIQAFLNADYESILLENHGFEVIKRFVPPQLSRRYPNVPSDHIFNKKLVLCISDQFEIEFNKDDPRLIDYLLIDGKNVRITKDTHGPIYETYFKIIQILEDYFETTYEEILEQS